MDYKLLDLLLPRDSSFFTHMNDQAENFLRACEQFHAFLSTIEQMDERTMHQHVSDIKNFEVRGDEMKQRILEDLDAVFIAPMDQDAIRSIVTYLGQCMDSIKTLSRRIEIYGIRSVPETGVRFCGLMVDIASELNRLIQNLKSKKDIPTILKRMHILEQEANALFHSAVAVLFKTHDPVEIIKFKELYEQFEYTVDRVNHIGKVVRGITEKQE